MQIRASPKGGLTWQGVCRDRSGRQRWTTHGDYPGLSIAQAREAQDAFRVAVRSGGALPERRRRPKSVAATPTAATPAPVSTLTTVLDVYEHQKGHRLRSWPRGRTRITRVFGALFSRPLAVLTLGDLQLAADGYRTPGEAGFAVRTLHPVFTWAAHQGRTQSRRDGRSDRRPLQPLPQSSGAHGGGAAPRGHGGRIADGWRPSCSSSGVGPYAATVEEAFLHIDPKVDRQVRNDPDKWRQRMIDGLEASLVHAELDLFFGWSDRQGETRVQPAAWFNNWTRIERHARPGVSACCRRLLPLCRPREHGGSVHPAPGPA